MASKGIGDEIDALKAKVLEWQRALVKVQDGTAQAIAKDMENWHYNWATRFPGTVQPFFAAIDAAMRTNGKAISDGVAKLHEIYKKF